MSTKEIAEQLCREANHELKLRGRKGCIKKSLCPDCGEELGDDNGIVFCGSCPMQISDKTDAIVGGKPQPHHWACLLNAHTDGNWFVKPMPSGINPELINMDDFGTKKFKNQYLTIIDNEKFYQKILNIIGV